ncbi:MAG: A24 family peptidase [Armatimonadetes bacterium]|nr:A24 family peptidase [Armatimonadota bacterium]
MAPEQIAVLVATCTVLIISVFTDVRDGKIYNAVTLPFALLGLILNIIDKGLSGLLFSLAGLGMGLALFFLSAFLGRILGAGDCKLFAAVGALQGPQFLLWAILFSLAVGGVFAILVALWRGVLRHSLRRVWEAVYFKIYLKMPMDISTSSSKLRLPYAVAILAGSLFTIWYQQGRLP